MARNKEIFKCFGYLEKRLYRIKRYADWRMEHHLSFAIDEIINIGALDFDPEDVQNVVLVMIDKIQVLKDSLPVIVESISFDREIEYPNGEYANCTVPEVYSPEESQKRALVNCTSELEFYLLKLDELNNELNESISNLGPNNYANAGYKAMLDLNIEQVGSFFNLLYEAKLLLNYKYDGTKFTKKELAVFIQKNFSCKTNESISVKSLTNGISRKNQIAEGFVEDKLAEIIALAKSPYPPIK